MRAWLRRAAEDVFGPQPRGPGADGTGSWRPDPLDAYCPRCGASIDASGQTPRGCPFCVGRRWAWDRLIRLGPYTPPLREWITAIKFDGQWRWVQRLGAELALQLPPADRPARTLVCDVPMHWARRWRRGFNQAQLAASAIARQRGWPHLSLLRRTRYTRPQTAIEPSRRERNVADSFALTGVDLAGWDVWLVDDVKTSGSTLGGCARLLRGAGARCVNVAVLAVADPKDQNFTRI